MSRVEAKCDMCQRPATHILVRSELGGADDRMRCCSDPNCRPPEGIWQRYPLDEGALAREYDAKERR